jgi:hypothetical protein
MQLLCKLHYKVLVGTVLFVEHPRFVELQGLAFSQVHLLHMLQYKQCTTYTNILYTHCTLCISQTHKYILMYLCILLFVAQYNLVSLIIDTVVGAPLNLSRIGLSRDYVVWLVAI